MATRATRARWFCVLCVGFASLDTRLDRWFAKQVVETPSEPSIIHGVIWKELDVLRGLAENLTTHAPDPALDYFVVRPWKDNAHDNGRNNVDGWMDRRIEYGAREIAEMVFPANRTVGAHLELLASLRSEGGALVIRELERLAVVRDASRRAAIAVGRKLWAHDQVHIFHTFHETSGSYGWHYDLSDNLLYALAGSKRFRVAGPEKFSDVVLDEALADGSLLYVPRLLHHNGVGGAGGSLLLSVALKPVDEGVFASRISRFAAVASALAAIAGLSAVL